jgi:3-hydroxyisobutyrate dehydrogenase
MKVGFIGTGAMGRPMARNLVAKGFTVVAYDVEPAALAAARTLGARAAASAAAGAEESEVVVTMLPSSPHVEAAYLGAGGVLEGIAPGRLCVDMSTVDPGTSRRLASRLGERGVRFIDAPVSGGVSGAESGTLAIMVGGAPRDLEDARPVLAAMGAHIVHVGAVGAGAVAKLCNNLIAGVVTVAVSEAFRIGEGFGVDARVLTDCPPRSASCSDWSARRRRPSSRPTS